MVLTYLQGSSKAGTSTIGSTLNAVAAPKKHRAFVLFCPLLEPATEVDLVRDADQAPHLVLMIGWQILQAIDAFVGVRQREQVE